MARVSSLSATGITGARRDITYLLSWPGDFSKQPGLRTTNAVQTPRSRFEGTKGHRKFVSCLSDPLAEQKWKCIQKTKKKKMLLLDGK